MSVPEIGVDVDDLRLHPKDGLRKASELGFRAVELATVAGDLEPSSLSASGRRHLARHADGLGLRLAALIADMPGLRLTDPRTVDERVERTCRVIQLARDLRVPVVSASASALTNPQTAEPSPPAIAALERIGEFADLHGIVYALRPAHDDGERLAGVLRELGCPSIQICLDPAAMVMVGANPLSVIQKLPEQIALAYARDGTAGLTDRAGRETRLGEGEVDLPSVLALLDAAEYAGPYILRRTDSANPASDLTSARDVLERLLPPG